MIRRIMKTILKKLAIFLLVINFVAFPLIACGAEPDKEIEGVTFEDTVFGWNGNAHTLEVTGELPEGVSATYENNVHDEFGTYDATCTLSGKGYITKTLNAKMTIKYIDGGSFNEDAYTTKNKLSDDTTALTDWQKAGTFSDGRTEVLLVTPEDINNDEKVRVGLTADFNNDKSVVDAYYKTAAELRNEFYIEPPYEDNNGYLVMDSKVPKNTTHQYMYLSLIPSCTKQEFVEADFLEFYMYFCVKSNQNNDGSAINLYTSGSSQFACDNNAWVKVRISLDYFLAPRSDEMYNFVTSSSTKGVKSRADLYEFLCAGYSFMYFKATLKHLDAADMTYKVFFSEPKLKVATPDEGLSRLKNNFTKLNETQVLPELNKTVLKNVFPRYINGLSPSAVVAYDGVEVIKMDINSSTLNNITYMQVNPSKSLKQVEQYDALAVTMMIESENPYPYVVKVGVPTQYSTSTKHLARFSANKWVTFEIPMEYLKVMLPYMENNVVFDLAGTGYVWTNSPQELFYITYEYIKDGQVKLAKDLYSTVSNWKQYPMTIYLKSLKLIKKQA